MRVFLLFFIFIFSSLAFAADQDVVEPVDNGLDSISLGKLLQDFSKRKDISLLVDSSVDAKIQLLGTTSDKIDYPELHTILNLHQYGMAEIDGMYVVAPMSELRQRFLVLSGESDQRSGSETILTIVDVQHVPAPQMIPILRPLIPQHGYLSAYVPSNKLILNTSKNNTEKLIEIIQRLDVKTDFTFHKNQKKE